MMKRLILLFIACMVIASVAIGGVSAAAEDTTKERLIHTSATGEVTTTPDQAEISVSVQTENPDPKRAQSDNAAIMADVIAALKAAGVAEADLKTTGFSMYPVYDESGSIFAKNIKYYRVTNTLLITVKDISKTGDLVDLAVANGANNVNGVTFTISDEKQQALRDDALTDAVQLARADADAVAKAAGLTITGVREITVGGTYVPYARAEMMSYADGKAAATPLQPGEVTVTASVSISYTCA
ncbi:MAG: SIMPL domain-containing protein [Methanomicrobiales archaeon]|nr:SIMPL domain-containing protein [Methanomicrobiales archaeon]